MAVESQAESTALATPSCAAAWRGISGWTVAAILIFLTILSPILGLVWAAASGDLSAWPHLLQTVLPKAAWITFLLMAGVCLVSIVLGAGTAWLVTMYRFPGRNVLQWALVIPLAVPTYLAAFCYVEIWDYSGWLQTALRASFGFQSARDYWFPDIRSLPGAILIMSFVLYPYVYMTARASFLAQSGSTLEASRVLGCTPWGSFWRVGLPLARPAIAAGSALAMMECLNDIGAVEHFGVNTLTISVYDTWLERGSLPGAAQIACVMLIAVILLFALERWSRGKQAFYQRGGRTGGLKETRLSGLPGILAMTACALPVVLGFGTPALFLILNTITFAPAALSGDFLTFASNSFILAACAGLLATVCALLLVFARRLADSTIMRAISVASCIGYAVPGTVLAIGVLIVLGGADHFLGFLSERTLGIGTGLLLSGTSGAIVFAYAVRFFAISQGSQDAGMTRIHRHLDDAARSLGRSPSGLLRDVHIPMLKPAIGAGALLVFVDSMKELPATILLRPFNFDTLATHVYTLASLDLFEEAAPAALSIVLIGLIPVIVLNTMISADEELR
ncbi:MAG: iron ABC transporter permease [Pseudomonadota bacterium]